MFNMHWFILIIGALATFRISLMFSKEGGPAHLFRKLRRLPPPKSSTKEGLSCIFCVSVYASALVTGYLYWWDIVPVELTPLYWLGMSALAIFANQTWTKGSL